MGSGFRFCALAWAALVAGGAQAQTNERPQAQAYETVLYSSGKLKIEAYVYKPEGAGPFPVVIYNHGSRAGHEREDRVRLRMWESCWRAAATW